MVGEGVSRHTGRWPGAVLWPASGVGSWPPCYLCVVWRAAVNVVSPPKRRPAPRRSRSLPPNRRHTSIGLLEVVASNAVAGLFGPDGIDEEPHDVIM